MASDPVRQRIKFPPSKDMQVWQELDGTLVKGLKKVMKKEGAMKTFSDFIYASCLENFGSVESRHPTKPKESRWQLELSKFKIEKKALRNQWKRSGEVERVGLSVLWKEVKRRINILHKAEKAYERRQEFFRDMGGLCSNPQGRNSNRWSSRVRGLTHQDIHWRSPQQSSSRESWDFWGTSAYVSIQHSSPFDWGGQKNCKKKQGTAPHPAPTESHICCIKDVQEPSNCSIPK